MLDGFICALKPPGMTSHDMVSFIRKVYGIKKVGHAGTLDPGAAGILPIALGKATRMIEYMTDADKSYRAELTFGFSTDSGDDTGTILTQENFIMPSLRQINETFQQFIGENIQIPPIYSAIKINGIRACDLARKNIEVEIPSRTIHIHNMELLEVEEPKLLFDVDCSKGTYIRTLCIDIGKKLNIPAVMSFLVRTRVGCFSLANAYTLDEIKNNPQQAIQPIDSVLVHMPAVELTKAQISFFQQGQKIIEKQPINSSSLVRIYDKELGFIGIARYQAETACIVPVKVVFR